MFKFKRLFQALKKHYIYTIKKLIYSELIPDNPLYDDLYLVEFPKSGITWLMYLMSNVNLRMSGTDRFVTFFNVEMLIIDIHITKQLKKEILPFPGCRIIKSHSLYNPFYNYIIYLIRDPRDVMVSYYYFTKNLNMFNGNISEFIRSKKFGIKAWCKHLESWVTQTKPHQRINFIRYEDLKLDAKNVLRRIYTLLGYNIPEEIFDYAVSKSSFELMRKDEEYYRKLNFTLPQEFKFFRKGEIKNYKVELSDEDIQFIIKKANRWMKLFGYL